MKGAKRSGVTRNVNTDEFEQMPLRVHRFLTGVPLHSLSRVALPGGHEGMTLPEIKAVIGFDSGSAVEVGPVTTDGYALYMAVYVKRLNWFTPIYLALITPMLKWIIYPSMEKGFKRRWEQAFPRDTTLTPVLPQGV
jgi:hypothetical protein